MAPNPLGPYGCDVSLTCRMDTPGSMSGSRNYSLMLHGGAGAFTDIRGADAESGWLDGIRAVLEHGRTLLEAGRSALQTVEACAMRLEDDPRFNAGRGSVLNAAGRVEMDAAIMDGRDLSAGAVAAIDGIANPVSLARRILVECDHVLLVSEGAMQFADKCGLPRVGNDYFHTPARLEQFRRSQQSVPVRDVTGEEGVGPECSTIGAVARDLDGNLAAATSSGGIFNKHVGRVGDSPIIGAGVYADNETCAVSATGCGEHFMRSVFAKTIADFVFMQGMDASRATAAGIDYLVRRVNGRGGAIVIDRHGNCASGFTTRRMIHGWIEKGAEPICRF
jgi:beta-aspartyl-peptidase (threonine type)